MHVRGKKELCSSAVLYSCTTVVYLFNNETFRLTFTQEERGQGIVRASILLAMLNLGSVAMQCKWNTAFKTTEATYACSNS